ncbi:methylated-DNA--[protein]-cysteine S-methyltransferase [Gilvimarinus sp. SDUM040013]|uniref:Methylated-DNA--[protein]-cysteine S-methyltransferase n=1 Tax=Gilvimarinus gilvus TaxID=3058038 RepID=A0ABU4RUR7_9GAMM|nr:methylated-DNA--[protein]-cysteine S-methyltransferase [Gilvimarinus sp. SDUM040013]MDO3388503.1 methylated-DNA--[protein]-cysteine S-methyltransferase [Gilvimarinus sp. SDUM040013]MDX6848625.1 methylated-DNA--[protein]-cysteine S-methyltransferase [Gilvimarinus sp. SDUM040013]
MTKQSTSDSRNGQYHVIAQAIHYIRSHYQDQPSLAAIAAHVNLSPDHLQRVFSQWAGVSPKKFSQYLSIEHAKSILTDDFVGLEDAAYSTGLSGTGRLHDLFINIESMTPGQWRNGGEKLSLNYQFIATEFGELLAAATEQGICHLQFSQNREAALRQLRYDYPKAQCVASKSTHLARVESFFQHTFASADRLHIHLKGTDFQLQVWKSLLKIPPGRLTTYGQLATANGQPNAARAVGGAIGKNPIAILIPCHRVIQASGCLGGYRWGEDRKAALIGREAAQLNNNSFDTIK